MRQRFSLFFCKTSLLVYFLSIGSFCFAQFTRQDSLRGSITPERAWWDLNFYELEIEVDPVTKSINGSNTVHYKVLRPNQRMQIDLQHPLRITEIKRELESYGVSTRSFLEKKELVTALVDAREKGLT
ncbi:MAG: hypothetical protein RQ756_09080, partial [Flavobacteriaceae bacterium]|nr:hypothetical protein [Flavobacteriaceae bacterium]